MYVLNKLILTSDDVSVKSFFIKYYLFIAIHPYPMLLVCRQHVCGLVHQFLHRILDMLTAPLVFHIQLYNKCDHSHICTNGPEL